MTARRKQQPMELPSLQHTGPSLQSCSTKTGTAVGIPQDGLQVVRLNGREISSNLCHDMFQFSLLESPWIGFSVS